MAAYTSDPISPRQPDPDPPPTEGASSSSEPRPSPRPTDASNLRPVHSLNPSGEPMYPSTLSANVTQESSAFNSPHPTVSSTASFHSPDVASDSPQPSEETSQNRPENLRKVSAGTRARHSRRPSRAERYETLVEQARQVLERGMQTSPVNSRSAHRTSIASVSTSHSGSRSGPEGIPGGRRISRGSLRTSWSGVGGFEIGLGIDPGGGAMQSERVGSERDGRDPLEEVEMRDREWRDTVRSLLLVVDGMSQQLATHDELAAQLKIAQSNLALAETHSEFLEETLRRRDEMQVSHRMSKGGRTRSTTEDAEAVSGSAGAEDGPTSTSMGAGARAFFRLPTTSSSSTSSSALNKRKDPASTIQPLATPALRSVVSSPRLGGPSPRPGDTSPSFPPPPGSPANPTSPPRFSTSTLGSIESAPLSNQPFLALSPNPSTQSLPSPNVAGGSPNPDVASLQNHLVSLESECLALKSSKESLKRNNESLVKKCAELEKTQEDLMSELENLSVELFSEANALVAEERRARAQAEEQVEVMREQMNSLTAELDSLRAVIASRRLEPLNVSSPDLPAIPRHNSTSSTMTTVATPTAGGPSLSVPNPSGTSSEASSPNPDASPSISSNRQSTASTGRKWFSFGRNSSVPAPAATANGSTGTPSPNPSFATPPLGSSSTSSNQTTPVLSLSPYLNTPIPSSSSTGTSGILSPVTPDSGLNPPPSMGMERSNSGSSYATARSDSWFGFGGKIRAAEVTEEPDEIDSGCARIPVNLVEDDIEVVKTPIRATFEGEVVAQRSPLPPKKEDSPSRPSPSPTRPSPSPTSPERRSHNPSLAPTSRSVSFISNRPPSPAPSHTTTASSTSFASSIDKELPRFAASPPLPPLPPTTPLASALSSPIIDAPIVETDPTKLPFATAASAESGTRPEVASRDSMPTLRRERPAGTTQPRPAAIHIPATAAIPTILSERSPASSAFPQQRPSPTQLVPAGGPSQSEMTAGSRSPRSPNELRWREVSGSMDAASRPTRGRTTSGRSANGSTRDNVRDSTASSLEKKGSLPPSPKLVEVSESASSVTRDKKPLPGVREDALPSVPAKPAATASSIGGGGGGGPSLRIDTAGLESPSSTFTSSSVTPRPTDAGPRSAQPRSLPSIRPSLFRHASSSTPTGSSQAKSGMTPSSSMSSISSGHSGTSNGSSSRAPFLFGKSRRSRDGASRGQERALSPDGTKAVEDLEKLMESMMGMLEDDEFK
ncbi:hypothetical protein JCM10212_000987 [Sporobolomyces blumeae]